MTMGRRPGSFAGISGEEGPGGGHRRRPPLPGHYRAAGQAEEAGSLKRPITLLRMCSRAAANSATRQVRYRCRRRGSVGPTPRRPRRRTIGSLVLFDRGDEVEVQAGEQGIRFLLISRASRWRSRWRGTGRF